MRDTPPNSAAAIATALAKIRVRSAIHVLSSPGVAFGSLGSEALKVAEILETTAKLLDLLGQKIGEEVSNG